MQKYNVSMVRKSNNKGNCKQIAWILKSKMAAEDAKKLHPYVEFSTSLLTKWVNK